MRLPLNLIVLRLFWRRVYIGMPPATRLSRQQDGAAGISFVRVARKMLHNDVDWNDGGQLVWASPPLNLSLAPPCFDSAEFRFDPAVSSNG
jgi:hypothetical protein